MQRTATIIFLFTFFLYPLCRAQMVKDSLVVKKVKKDYPNTHSPKKATIMSACLPGLGQAYNYKYWKIPVIYAGLGTFGYFMTYSNSQYNDFKQAYSYRTDNDPSTVDNYPAYSEAQLKQQVDFYRHYRDLNIILMAVVYTLNIVDANVDAHLFTFDVGSDLTFNLSPRISRSVFMNSALTELALTVKF